MLNDMNANIVDTLVKVDYFHAVSIFFDKAKGPLNAGPERFSFLVDQTVRHCWPIFSVSVLKICAARKAKFIALFDILTGKQERLAGLCAELKAGIFRSSLAGFDSPRFYRKTPGA
ncbi:MAG: hypothetical protein R6T98_10430 [Desulfatiglandales bacterium]